MDTTTASAFPSEAFAELGDLRLALPNNSKGLGPLILSPDSPHLIAGIQIDPFSVWPDDRGYFLEVQRVGYGASAHFPQETTQVSVALSHPGTIKAFHYHLHQTDYWCCAVGLLQVALVDLRIGSPTFGLRNTMYVGPLRPWKILIPPGIGHGYKAVHPDSSVLVYVTSRFYNPKDEGRIAYNDSQINYDWETQHK